MNKEKHYCEECSHYLVYHREIKCDLGFKPIPILNGFTDCEEFKLYHKYKKKD
jgi:hypothetical protein